jgi:hypothetical protein
MEPDEEIFEVCDRCGADIVDDSVAFGISDEGWLCANCANALGGEYDPERGEWTHAPKYDAKAPQP